MSSRQSLGPISVGNIISGALRLYRDNFKTYFLLAFKGSAWLLVPIFGWAKYCALIATISRLAYGEVAEKPESKLDAQRAVDSRKWTLLGTAILVSLIVIIISFALAFGFFLIIGILFAGNTSRSNIGWYILIAIIVLIVWLVLILQVAARYSVAEMPIAIEGESGSLRAIRRSLELTKGFVWRIQLIFFLAFLVSSPITIGVRIINAILQAILLRDEMAQLRGVVTLIGFILSLAASAIIAPFWSCIRALLYYDLRARKEGIDLY